MSRARGALWACWIAGALLLLPRQSTAHASDPLLLDIHQTAAGQMTVTWKTSGRGEMMPLGMPAECGIRSHSAHHFGDTSTQRWSLDCGTAGVQGRTFYFEDLRPSQYVLVRVETEDLSFSSVVRHPAVSFAIPSGSSGGGSVASYARLGIEHIATGYDHLAFVLCLLFLDPRPLAVVRTVTAFTLAHSLTLGLAMLGVAALPAAPVEALIALSVLLVAAEVARMRAKDSPRTPARRPWAVALAFGLLHGFGFAGALSEVGLQKDDVLPGLLGFNVGVELGQVAFVALALGLARICRRLVPLAVVRGILVYVVGSLAAFWLLDRVGQFWGS